MLIRAIIYAILIYFGYTIYKSFKALKKAAQQNINKAKQQDTKISRFDKSNAEELHYEEVDDENDE